MQVRVGAMQLALAPSIAARIFRCQEHVIVQLESGSLVYSAKILGIPLAIFADDIKFARVTRRRATGQIELLLSAQSPPTSCKARWKLLPQTEAAPSAKGSGKRQAPNLASPTKRRRNPPTTTFPRTGRTRSFTPTRSMIPATESLRNPVKKMPLTEKVVKGAAAWPPQ